MCSFDFNQDYTPVDLVKHGFIDAMKLFIKQEPHKLSKLNDNRERLIFSMSLIDNVINILLANKQNKVEIYHHLSTASQAGLSFTDEGVTNFLSTIPEYELLETDVSGWDFTLKPWEFQLDLDRRADLNNGHNTLWYHLLKVQYYCIQRKVFVLGDGLMYAQVLPGIMPSGYNSTTSTNSAIRAGNHYVMAAKLKFKPWCKTMGDDSIEKNHPGLVQAYRDLGKTIKSAKTVTKVQGFEFCSHMFKDGLAYPVSENKQLFNLLNYSRQSTREIEERYTQFKHELRHHPKFNSLMALVLASGWLAQVQGHLLGGWSLDTKTVTVLSQMPRDCTVSSLEWLTMYSPGCHTVSNTMTKTKSQKARRAARSKITSRDVNRLAQQLSKTKIKNKTQPSSKGVISKTGQILGSRIGGLFGVGTMGGNIGKFLGNGIASILGEGDYTMMGPSPSYNVLVNSSQIPKFSTSDRTNIICHREYLGDITGTSSFTNTSYPLNPGMSQTFPWLATVAQNFQEYAFHGVIFEFRPLTTDFANSGVPGVVVMATNYNADSPSFTTKQEMENSEYAVSVKPTLSLIHGIECSQPLVTIPHRYVRTGTVPSNQDLRLYDYGNFQFATQNNSSTVVLGELWVSYMVEFFKPILPANVGPIVSSKISRSTFSSASPLGTTTITNTGSLSMTVTPTVVTWFAQPGQQYIITLTWNGSVATVSSAAPNFSGTGLTLKSYYFNDTSPSAFAPNNGAVTKTMAFTAVAISLLTTPGNISFTLDGAGVFPTSNTFVDIIVSEFDNNVTA